MRGDGEGRGSERGWGGRGSEGGGGSVYTSAMTLVE